VIGAQTKEMQVQQGLEGPVGKQGAIVKIGFIGAAVLAKR
jgi:type IV secretory pathway VirB2 component (pilin)